MVEVLRIVLDVEGNKGYKRDWESVQSIYKAAIQLAKQT